MSRHEAVGGIKKKLHLPLSDHPNFCKNVQKKKKEIPLTTLTDRNEILGRAEPVARRKFSLVISHYISKYLEHLQKYRQTQFTLNLPLTPKKKLFVYKFNLTDLVKWDG